jgi:hypothetical protein
MKKVVITVVVLMNLLLVSCSTKSDSKVNELKKDTIEVPEIKEAEKVIDVEYYLDLSAKPISAWEVEFDIKTNIPLPAELWVSVSLKNQKSDDIYKGFREVVTLRDTNQVIILDTKKSEILLPKGNYIAAVDFWPRWAERRGNKRVSKIKDNLHSEFEILLKGSGQSVDDIKKQDEMQMWVMENVWCGTTWDKNIFIGKLGKYIDLTVTNKDPQNVKVYYFPIADMTIFVEVYKGTVATWRMGKDTNLRKEN